MRPKYRVVEWHNPRDYYASGKYWDKGLYYEAQYHRLFRWKEIGIYPTQEEAEERIRGHAANIAKKPLVEFY